MNVASRELSQELHQLSGWRDDTHGRVVGWLNDATEPLHGYSLGYLLRKLPSHFPDHMGTSVAPLLMRKTKDWYVIGYVYHREVTQKWVTPEDAACKLLIELFKSGALVRKG